jgi:capsular exopolysaccharide synthesis family protein
MVAAVAALFVAGAAAYVHWTTPVYSATSRILVERETPTILNSDNEQAVSSSKNYLNTQCSLLKSTPIAAAAIEAVDVKSLQSLAGVSDPVAYLKSNLLAELGLKDDLIICTLESPYPQEAAALVNAVVDAYVRFQSAQKRSTASDVLKVLQDERAQREADMKQKSQALMAFKQANGMLSFADEKGNIITQRLGRLSEEITDAQLQTIRAAADYKAAKAALEGDPARRGEWLKALQAKGELRDMDAMHQRLSDSAVGLEVRLATSPNARNHPLIQSAHHLLEQVKAKMDDEEQKMAQAYLAMSARKLEMAQNAEAAIQARYQDQERLAQDLNARMAEQVALESALSQAERYNEVLDSRINELMTIKQAPAMNIRVLERAEASKSPVRPMPARALIAALAMGLFCGSGLALLRRRMEQRMMSLPEIVALLDLPVLGAIPYIPRRLRQEEMTVRPGVQRNPLSDVAEAHRMIRASISFGLPRASARTILVTSSAAKEGKSTVSSGLAWAMSEAGERVLLIDADFRKPVQHTIFNLGDKAIGLTDVIGGQATLAEAIAPSGINGLDVLPCGTIPISATEIINGEPFADMIDELTHRYDRIVLDSPPAGLVADARILAARADVTLLVVRAEKTTRKQALHALHGLSGVGARLLGVIVNVARNPLNDVYPRTTYYGHDEPWNRPMRNNGNGNGHAGAGENGNGNERGGSVHEGVAPSGTSTATRQLPVEG